MTPPNNTVAGLAEKLLPCPFCGAHASRWDYDTSRGDVFGVCCSNDDCPADVYAEGDSRDAADAAWNRRASPAPSALPEGVYYSAEHDNFYRRIDGAGMGAPFYNKWRPAAADFPQAGAMDPEQRA